MGRPGTFKKGQQGLGGKRDGAGRPPDWLQDKCKSLLDKHKLIDFVAGVASGEEVERSVTQFGKVFYHVAGVKERLRAVEMLKDWAYGKSPQNVSLQASESLEALLTRVNEDNG